MTLDDHKVHQKKEKHREGFALDYVWPSLLDFSLVLTSGNPSKKCFFQKVSFFGDSGFPSVILVDKSLKALCLSSKMMYQHLLYLLSLCSY